MLRPLATDLQVPHCQTVCFPRSGSASWEARKTERRALVLLCKEWGRAFQEKGTLCVQALSKESGFAKERPSEAMLEQRMVCREPGCPATDPAGTS